MQDDDPVASPDVGEFMSQLLDDDLGDAFLGQAVDMDFILAQQLQEEETAATPSRKGRGGAE
jgi:hypothetical protein